DAAHRTHVLNVPIPDLHLFFSMLRLPPRSSLFPYTSSSDLENGETFRPLNKAQTDQALAQLQGAAYKVVKRDARPTSTKPGAPFITSTLQQAASTRLGFSEKTTMMMAQRLHEAGYNTYIRTDSTNMSAD